MSISFDKNQIVSSTELIRSFGKYMGKDLTDHDIFVFKHNSPEAVLITYARYEEMKKELEELRELFEHLAIYDIVQKRKDSPTKEVPIEQLKKKYAL